MSNKEQSIEVAQERSLIPERYRSILRIAISSYKFVIDWRHDLYRLLWPFVLAEFVGIWGAFLGRSPIADETSQFLGKVCTVMALVVLIPLAARVQRFALDPKPVKRWELWQFGKDEGLILWAMVSQAMPMFVSFCFFGTIILIIDGGQENYTAPVPLFFAVLTAISISVFLSRLLIIYPMTLAKGRPSVKETWRLTRGHYIRLLLILGFSTVPFRLVYRLGAFVDSYVWSDPLNVSPADMLLYLLGGLIPSAIAAIGQIMMTLVAITLVYKEICNEKDIDPTSGSIANFQSAKPANSGPASKST